MHFGNSPSVAPKAQLAATAFSTAANRMAEARVVAAALTPASRTIICTATNHTPVAGTPANLGNLDTG